MSRFLPSLAAAALLIAVSPIALVACGSDSGDRRVIEVTQTNDGCTPDSVDLKTGEQVVFKVTNKGDKARELEGINGTKLSEVLVPEGRTRNINYDAPSTAGNAALKCYIPGGNTTVITLNVSGDTTSGGNADAAASAEDNSLKTDKPANDTVAVKLVSFEVSTDKPSVAAGPTKFVATNASKTDVHELAVLRVKDDGSYDNTGEVEDIDPEKSGEITLDLPAGKYLLSCLIVPGEAGSTVDHFKSGMHLEFEVK
jgi:uncharacterized cupredoxin-like copper-binding protein